MNKQAAIAAVIALTSVVGACEAPQPVDLILAEARVYNADRRDSPPSTLVIDNGRILAVGDASLLERYEGPTRALSGRLVLPGFHDSHTHLIYGGRQLMQCDLSGLASIAAMQSKLADCDSALDPEEWLLGGGWNLSLFPDANPNRSMLDAINPDRATALVGEDGHSTWASSRALALAGITAETPNPPDGVIERDATGSPSGTLRETAQNLVHAFAPAMLVDDVLIGAERAIQMAHQYGITSAIDAATTTEDIEIYEQLKASGALTLRMALAITVNDPGLGIGSRADIDVSERGNVEALRTDAAKIFVDGVLEGETAALIEPYESHAGGHGHLHLDDDELFALVASLHGESVQVMFHAIGDLGVRKALDAVDFAIAEHGQNDARHHISHLQLVDPADRARFEALNVTANMQSLWAMPDTYITDINLPVVGEHRVNAMYPFGSLARAGARLAAGSDWSVSSMNPFLAIETAVTRQDAMGQIEGALNPAEAIALEEAVRAHTAHGAYLMHQDTEVGELSVGMLADLIVVDQDIFAVPSQDISETKVLLTLVGGEVVFEREEAGTNG